MRTALYGLTFGWNHLKHHLADWQRRTRSHRISRYEAERESAGRFGIL